MEVVFEVSVGDEVVAEVPCSFFETSTESDITEAMRGWAADNVVVRWYQVC